jgi:hypothetical protein
MATERDQAKAGPQGQPDNESGQPGGGRGRIDEVGRTGVYPGSGPYPPGDAEVRTPETFVHGQRDEEGREVEGGSEPIMTEDGTVLGGATPPSSSPPRGQGPQANPSPRDAKK